MRCLQHGLQVTPDRRCLLCRSEAGARRRARLMYALRVAAGALLGVGVGGPLGSPALLPTGAEPGAPVGHPAPAAAVRAPAAAPSMAGGDDELGPNAEGAVLGRPLHGEQLPVVSERAPDAPRAGTVPLGLADPSAFELR